MEDLGLVLRFEEEEEHEYRAMCEVRESIRV